MYLGPKLVVEPRTALQICEQLDTRFREYTCVHGSGHAFMRGFHGSLAPSVAACKKLGPENAPDCAQGAFHDYWISLGSSDGAQSAARSIRLPSPCAERSSSSAPAGTATSGNVSRRRASARLRTFSTCAAISTISSAPDASAARPSCSRELQPIEHATHVRTARPDATRTTACAASTCRRSTGCGSSSVRLISRVASFRRRRARGARHGSGRTLGVLTNSAFRRHGCDRITPDAAAISCRAGAARLGRPLRTSTAERRDRQQALSSRRRSRGASRTPRGRPLPEAPLACPRSASGIAWSRHRPRRARVGAREPELEHGGRERDDDRGRDSDLGAIEDRPPGALHDDRPPDRLERDGAQLVGERAGRSPRIPGTPRTSRDACRASAARAPRARRRARARPGCGRARTRPVAQRGS